MNQLLLTSYSNTCYFSLIPINVGNGSWGIGVQVGLSLLSAGVKKVLRFFLYLILDLIWRMLFLQNTTHSSMQFIQFLSRFSISFFVPGICFSCSYSKLNIELHTLVEQGLETLNLFSIMSWSRMIGRYQPNTYTAFQTDWAVFFRVFGHTIFLRMEFFRVGQCLILQYKCLSNFKY